MCYQLTTVRVITTQGLTTPSGLTTPTLPKVTPIRPAISSGTHLTLTSQGQVHIQPKTSETGIKIYLKFYLK